MKTFRDSKLEPGYARAIILTHTGQLISANTDTDIAWGTEVRDDFDAVSVPDDTIVPGVPGFYLVSTSVDFDSAGYSRFVHVRKNSSFAIPGLASASATFSDWRVTIATVMELDADDSVSVTVFSVANNSTVNNASLRVVLLGEALY